MSAPGSSRWMWAAGLAVAAGAAIATAHGLYEVARAAGAPTPIAALYPLITDGLALVAYATTTRLRAAACSYAWAVVVLAAGLSGVAQAAYLAGGVHAAPTWLRFGVGAWPALAAAIVAHLLYLLGTAGRPTGHASNGETERPALSLDEPTGTNGTLDALYASSREHRVTAENADDEDQPRPSTGTPAPARERAEDAARAHRELHGVLPTVTELAETAGVARGTAGTVLKQLRAERPSLQVVTVDPQRRHDR